MGKFTTSTHRLDAQGNPAGGMTVGKGIEILWQDGPLGRGATRLEANGAFVEGVIEAAIDRLDFYQQTAFASHHNQLALNALHTAVEYLNARTADREAREVEGTHQL